MQHKEFFVACLCAAWCGSCREYQPAFEALRESHPEVAFAWVDIEDQSEVAGDIEVENFPMLVIQRGHDVLFCGAMLPDAGILRRLLESYMAQSAEQSQAYAHGNPQRLAWQGEADVRGRLGM
ncbi:MAG: thioredoxin family protein [Moraxellaceae bacterium]|nr:thioredoxin family protein [Moraxellaceae bacterium]